MSGNINIRKYESKDELGWIRCRVLSFLDTAYFDDVMREKGRYDNPSIELVAEINSMIVGLIDVEYEKEPDTVCSRGDGLGGMIWHLAVLPEYRNQGIGTKLLMVSERIVRKHYVVRLEAWTRDDDWVNRWYEKRGFELKNSYLHVYTNGKSECEEIVETRDSDMIVINAFLHYIGKNKGGVKSKFNRVHECNLYVKYL